MTVGFKSSFDQDTDRALGDCTHASSITIVSRLR
jgi:hypothetical protein